jgi:hypothetical protein
MRVIAFYKGKKLVGRPIRIRPHIVGRLRFTKSDLKKMGSHRSVATQKKVCENTLGFKFSKGNDKKAPGCGSCWCCKPLGLKPAPKHYQCHHWTKSDLKKNGKP